MSLDGSAKQRITNNDASDGDAAWSPDGTQIVFVSDRDGDQEIYPMNADGNGVSKVTNDSGADFDSSWSPDGSTIAFASNRNGSTDI